MFPHRPFIQDASPIEATDAGAHWLPEEDIAWKYLRVSGKTVTLAFIYFEHTIGLQGKNMYHIHKLDSLRGRDRRSIIAGGDCNGTPQEWKDSGLIELIDCRNGVPEMILQLWLAPTAFQHHPIA